jgi:NAD(P)H-nitrite reductase large subunit
MWRFAGHLVPNLDIAQALGCTTTPTAVTTTDLLATTIPHVYAIGEARGIGGLDCAIAEGHLVAAVICQDTSAITHWRQRVAHERQLATAIATTFATPSATPLTADTIVCRCEDVSHAQLTHARDWRTAKLQQRCGMGHCQGRICGAATQHLYGWGPMPCAHRSAQPASPLSPYYTQLPQTLDDFGGLQWSNRNSTTTWVDNDVAL